MAPGDHGRKPGAPAGIEKLLLKEFGVSPRPTLNRAEVAERIEEALQAGGIEYRTLDISDAPVRRGALFDAAGKRVPFPGSKQHDRCFVALVDPEPEARWSHDAYWAFVPADGDGEVVIQETRLPEHDKGPVRLERWP